jgi:poly-beta-1,6-N-acetyl-D-glucosamine synthase
MRALSIHDVANFERSSGVLPDARTAERGAASPRVKYCIITPIRDEEKFIATTIESVAAQTIRPAEWVIVDDGSTDGTGAIVGRYALAFPWIRVVHRKNRGFRSAGSGVMEAFNEGYASLQLMDWQFIVKLDGDLALPPDYFERCFEYFERFPRLGMGGGTICNRRGTRLEVENGPRFHVRGATKIYRRGCWEALGGLLQAPGWDTLDEVKANMLGWTTRSFSDLKLIQFRATGTAEGKWRGQVKDGRADYFSGYHPLFFAAKCLRRVFRKPFLVGSAGLAYGFLSGYAKRLPQVEDRSLIRYLRQQQMGRLFGRKTIWK